MKHQVNSDSRVFDQYRQMIRACLSRGVPQHRWPGSRDWKSEPYTLVVDRPADAGRKGLAFNGGQFLYLSIGGCISNDLFREAATRGIHLTTVRLVVCGDLTGQPAVSDPPSLTTSR